MLHRNAFLLLPLLAVLSASALAAEKEIPDKPNIIYIMVDDLGYGDLGCFGQEVIQTPRLDRMAEEGMRLTSYYAGCTVCRPSRISLWTGRHMGHTPISSNAQYHFQPSDVLVSELLKDAGYATGGIGKWACGGVGTSGHPNRNGFDFWMGYLDQSEAHNYYPTHLWLNDEKVPLEGNVLSDDPRARGRVATERVTWSHEVMAEHTLDFIRKNADRPFLLHAHWTIPHTNNEGGRVTGDGQEVPDYGIYADRDWPNPEKGFAAMVTWMDRDVGRILDLLEELEIDDRTLVIFTSDNGPHQEGGHKHEFFDSNGPLRGYKRDLHEGGIREPTIAWWPGVIEPGTVSDEPLGFWDWLPTACQLAGAACDTPIDGISFLPTLLGQEQTPHAYLFWKYQNATAARKGKWKAVRTKPDAEIALYDLSKDIGEENDIADQHPEIVAEMERIMAEAQKPLESKP